jgi:hypothetical protein
MIKWPWPSAWCLHKCRYIFSQNTAWQSASISTNSPHSVLSHPLMLCIFLKSIRQVQSTNPSDIICSLLSDYSIQSWEFTILPHPIWEHMFGHFWHVNWQPFISRKHKEWHVKVKLWSRRREKWAGITASISNWVSVQENVAKGCESFPERWVYSVVVAAACQRCWFYSW